MKYLVRSLRYFLLLAVIFVAMLYFKSVGTEPKLSMSEIFALMMQTQRGVMLLIAIVALSATYPVFGYVRRELKGSTTENRAQIITAFATQGYSLRSEKDGVLVFGADTILRRATLLFDDKIEVREVDGMLELQGVRRVTAYVAYRLEGYLRREN